MCLPDAPKVEAPKIPDPVTPAVLTPPPPVDPTVRPAAPVIGGQKDTKQAAGRNSLVIPLTLGLGGGSSGSGLQIPGK